MCVFRFTIWWWAPHSMGWLISTHTAFSDEIQKNRNSFAHQISIQFCFERTFNIILSSHFYWLNFTTCDSQVHCFVSKSIIIFHNWKSMDEWVTKKTAQEYLSCDIHFRSRKHILLLNFVCNNCFDIFFLLFFLYTELACEWVSVVVHSIHSRTHIYQLVKWNQMANMEWKEEKWNDFICWNIFL